MRRLRALFVRMRSQLRRDRLDSDLASELESHLAHHIDDNIRAGRSLDEARRHALAGMERRPSVSDRSAVSGACFVLSASGVAIRVP